MKHFYLMGLIGCSAPVASGSGAVETTRFPSAVELDKIRDAAPAQVKSAEPVVDTAQWLLGGPLAGDLANDTPTPVSNWDKALAEAVSRHAGLWMYGRDMQCAARELGRYYLARGGLPLHGLEDFIGGRCAATGVALNTLTLQGDVPPGMSDAQVFEQWKGSLDKLLQNFSAVPRSLGIYFGHKGNHAVVFVTSVERKAVLTPMSLLPAADATVIVEGETLRSYERLQAYANHGEFGFALCREDLAVSLPKFRFVCIVSGEDKSAWIDVYGFPPARFLGEEVAGILTLPRGAAGVDTYISPHLAALPGADPREALVGMVNAVRARAQLPTMILEVGESETSSALAPHYFAAAFGQESVTAADTIALGLLAGWNLDSPIIDADFTSGFVFGSRELAPLLASLLARPHGRRVLLKAEATRLAVGVFDGGEAVKSAGAVVTSYVPAANLSIDAVTNGFVERLNIERAKRGKTRLRMQTLPEHELVEYRQAVASGRWSAKEALQHLLEGRASHMRSGLRGWQMEGQGADTLALPTDLLELDDVALTLVVCRVRNVNSVWEHFVALVAIEPLQRAMR